MNRRALINRAGQALIVALAVLGALPVVLVIVDIYARGVPAIVRIGVVEFLTGLPPTPLDEAGGIGPALVGTLVMAVMGAAMGIAVGFPLGVYLGAYRHERLAAVSQSFTNVLVEYPTIAVGLFVYAAMSLALPAVNPVLRATLGIEVSQFSGLAGALALAIVMVPYVAIFTASAYASVGRELREAAHAITGDEAKALFVVLRKAAWRAILASFLIGTAKIMGETAPLLFTALGNDYYYASPHEYVTGPVGAVPLLIYYMAQTNYEVQNEVAYGAAAVLITLVLAVFVLARLTSREGL